MSNKEIIKELEDSYTRLEEENSQLVGELASITMDWAIEKNARVKLEEILKRKVLNDIKDKEDYFKRIQTTNLNYFSFEKEDYVTALDIMDVLALS